MTTDHKDKSAQGNTAIVASHETHARAETGVTEPRKSASRSIREEAVGSNVTSITREPSHEAVHHSSAPANAEQIIRRRAYELYEKRGREDGHAEEDWLRAETEVLGTVFRKARVG
jgi:hypothetical protein